MLELCLGLHRKHLIPLNSSKSELNILSKFSIITAKVVVMMPPGACLLLSLF